MGSDGGHLTSRPASAAPDAAILERIKHLDLAHRNRDRRTGRGGGGPILSLTFLRTLIRHLRLPMRRVPPLVVPRPADASVSLTFVGHATFMITSGSTRALTDPWLTDSLWGIPRAQAPSLHAGDRSDVDLILISHAHRDHLHAPSLRLLPEGATVMVPPRCRDRLPAARFGRVVELDPGQSVMHQDVRITAVAARHDGRLVCGGWRGANGYLLTFPQAKIYFAGDTGYFSGMADLGRRSPPDVALLPVAGYEPAPLRDDHLSPLDAMAAFEDLRARWLIPYGTGSIPNGYEPPGEAISWLQALCAAKGKETMDRLVVMDHGQTCGIGRSASVAPPATLIE